MTESPTTLSEARDYLELAEREVSFIYEMEEENSPSFVHEWAGTCIAKIHQATELLDSFDSRQAEERKALAKELRRSVFMAQFNGKGTSIPKDVDKAIVDGPLFYSIIAKLDPDPEEEKQR